MFHNAIHTVQHPVRDRCRRLEPPVLPGSLEKYAEIAATLIC